jgi:hypothetical protein
VLLTPVGGADYGNLTSFDPDDAFQTNIVYGIGPMATTRFPFNRADYYIVDNPLYPTPRHCAPITGTLVKSVVRHSDGALDNPLPLLDCVADMQVVYGYKNNPSDNIVVWTPDLAGLFPAGPNAAADIRSKLVEVRVHILAQSGQRDDSYTYPTTAIPVGSEVGIHSVDVSAHRNYRWKVYTIVVKPRNLAN